MSNRMKVWLQHTKKNWKSMNRHARIDAILEVAFYDFQNPPISF